MTAMIGFNLDSGASPVGVRKSSALHPRFLLAGAVAYYTLLSIVPMFALILVALSQVFDADLLLATMRDYLALVAPGPAESLTAQIATFLANWQVVGAVGVVILLFFSSLAFTVL